MKYSNGDVYTGQWSKGRRHGKGVYENAKGGLFRGKFVHDEPMDGTMENYVFQNGDIYHGTWLDGKQEVGKFVRSGDGHGFIGRFRENIPCEGVYTRPDVGDQGTASLDTKIDQVVQKYQDSNEQLVDVDGVLRHELNDKLGEEVIANTHDQGQELKAAKEAAQEALQALPSSAGAAFACDECIMINDYD